MANIKATMGFVGRGLRASCPTVTRAAREWPSFHITLLLKRKESTALLWKTTMLNPSEAEGRVRVPGGW